MFLYFLISFVSCIQQTEYSLIPPFINTDVNEIGNWTIRGTATNLKKEIRLTSMVPGSFGSICQRVPTLFKEWTMEMEISANGNDEHPGHGIWFFYTKDVCPDFAYKFDGFAFWINTTATDQKGYSPVYFAKGNGTDMPLSPLKPVGSVRARDPSKPLRIQVSRKNGRLTVDSTKDVIFERIVDEDIEGIPDYGYFSISAATTSRTDNNNLLSFRVYSLSDVDHPNKTFDFSSYNKKLIENDVNRRREMKQRRRRNMPNIMKTYKEANESKYKLSAQNEQDLKNAIRILAEAISRSENSLTASDLGEFIVGSVNAVVEQAYAKIENAANQYQDTEAAIQEMWNFLNNQLINLAIEEAKSILVLKEEILTFARSLNISTIKTKDAHSGLKEAASNVGENQSTNILLIISMVEITAYVIFFLYKRYTTDNFKKYD